MPTQTLTLHLPESLYARLQQRALESHRTVEAELLEVLSNAVPAEGTLTHWLAGAIEQLDSMDDAELWRAARSRLSKKGAARLEALHLKRQREGLTEDEARELPELVGQYERAMLIRARAAVLLRERGLDPAGSIPRQ
jgi:plasmid stability protein